MQTSLLKRGSPTISTVSAAITTGTVQNLAFRKIRHPSAIAVNISNVCTPAFLGNFIQGGFPSNMNVYSMGLPGHGDCTGNAIRTPCMMTDDDGILAAVVVICAK